MVDLMQTIDDQKGWFEWLSDKIPFYSGYQEKEQRRDADTLLRDHIARQLAEKLRLAEDVTGQLLTGPGMAQLDDMGKGNTRLQTLIDKIKTAAQGYAGFFDPIKFTDDELETLYEFDYNMIIKINEIGEAIDNVQAVIDGGDNSKIAPSVRRYVKTVTDSSALFDKRKDNIIGLA